jgi:hypothetical protein
MYDSTKTSGRKKRWAGAVGLLAAGAISGGALASTLSASAATSTPAASASTASSPGSNQARHPGPGAAQPVRPDEKSVLSATASTLRAAALKAVPGGTVYRIETDAGDSAYEAHIKKADGSLATVKFDKNLKVTTVESGMGAGDPAPAGARPAPPAKLARFRVRAAALRGEPPPRRGRRNAGHRPPRTERSNGSARFSTTTGRGRRGSRWVLARTRREPVSVTERGRLSGSACGVELPNRRVTEVDAWSRQPQADQPWYAWLEATPRCMFRLGSRATRGGARLG